MTVLHSREQVKVSESVPLTDKGFDLRELYVHFVGYHYISTITPQVINFCGQNQSRAAPRIRRMSLNISTPALSKHSNWSQTFVYTNSLGMKLRTRA